MRTGLCYIRCVFRSLSSASANEMRHLSYKNGIDATTTFRLRHCSFPEEQWEDMLQKKWLSTLVISFSLGMQCCPCIPINGATLMVPLLINQILISTTVKGLFTSTKCQLLTFYKYFWKNLGTVLASLYTEIKKNYNGFRSDTHKIK